MAAEPQQGVPAACGIPRSPAPSGLTVSAAQAATAPGSAEAAIAGVIRDAAASREPLLIEGHGTKAGMLRPVQAARTLSTAGLSGINLYAPKELIISAWAGTPLPEIEAALKAGG